MQFERTKDYELVRSIVTRDDIYPFLTSDGAIPAAKFQPPQTDWNWYVTVEEAGALLGLFWLVPYNSVCWEVHTCFLPALRGADAIRAYRDGVEWLWQHSPCRKVIGNVPAYNKPALIVALRGGAHIIGNNTKSLLKDGKLIDQIIVGKGIED